MSKIIRRKSVPAVVAAVALVGCSAVTGPGPAATTVAVHLTGAGCSPAALALPAAPITLVVTDDAGSGEFDIQDAAGQSVAKIAQIDPGVPVSLPLNLLTGYYTVECRTDDTTSMLTVGTPPGPPVDLGSVPAPTIPAPAGYTPADGNAYASTNLVANSAKYDPLIVDPTMVDAWGLADRPAGAGGHIWVAANKTGTSLEYVGDVRGAPLSQADLRTVSVPGAPDGDAGAPASSSALGQPTGVVFNPNSTGFVVNQGSVAGPAKFLFAGQDGTVSAWTEQANPNGSVTQLAWATRVVDDSAAGAQYFGLAVTPDRTRLLVADFGSDPTVRTFDTAFHAVPTVGFTNPFRAAGGPVKPGDLLPWNVTTIGDKVYVSYAAVEADENDATAPSTGEEHHEAGAGHVAEFTGDGALVKVLDDKDSLDAPWGVTVAPAGFGKLTGDLLVANFGDGTVAAFDASGTFVDYVRDTHGAIIVNPGIWALMPGNGASLGAADVVYFTAGPNAEHDGVFGRIAAARK